MQLDELIDELLLMRERHSNLPVIMLTAGGSGEVDRVEVVFDELTQRRELRLVEQP